MGLIERFPAEFDRMPHYGSEGCICGNIATPDRECPLHAANWIIERLTDDLRGAVGLLREAYENPDVVNTNNWQERVNALVAPEMSAEEFLGLEGFYVGELFGHRVWRVGMSDDGMPMERCETCGRQWVGVLNEPCEGQR